MVTADWVRLVFKQNMHRPFLGKAFGN